MIQAAVSWVLPSWGINLMGTHACWIFRQILAEYMDFWNYNKRIYFSVVGLFSNGMNFLQNFGHRAQYKNQIQDTLLNQCCLLKSLGNNKKASEHMWYYKFTPTIRNWHPTSSIHFEHTKKLHSAHSFFSSAEFKVNRRTYANIACLNAKDISTGNLYQLWHNSDSAEQGAVKT